MSSRGFTRTLRPLAVWLGVTCATTAAIASAPGAWAAARAAGPADRVAAVLVAACATALAAALCWLWSITTATVADVVAGSVTPRPGGATRRLVLLACGAAVAAGAAVPAHALDGGGAEVLVGLPLPERAVTPVRPPPTAIDTPAIDTYVVRSGDSLWSIARTHPAAGADVDSRWRAIWAANHDVVGEDPDLIHPGQALRLPGTDLSPDADGERR